MKPSPYNIFLPSGSEETEILLNSLTRTAVELPKQVAVLLREGFAPSDAETAQALRAMGALTDSPGDQKEEAFAAFRDEQANTREMHLVLPLTAKCNLACTYCYQVIHGDFQGPSAPRIVDWDAAAVERVVRFAAQELSAQDYGGLRIRWYGGEPLLRPDLIERIGGPLKEMTIAAGRRFSGQVVTNGVLLSPKAIDVLRAHGVDRLEISLDGPRTTHDLLRPTRGGAGTYDAVLKSIVAGAEHFKTMVFRVNVHSRNAGKITDWLGEVADLVRKPNIFLKFKLVEGDASNAIDYEAFSALALKYSARARSLGLNLLQKRLVTETCPAIRKNYFIIQSDLRVYRCPQNLGSDDHVGLIDAEGRFEENWRNAHWTGFDVSADAGCNGCSHLPHCNGGCPYNQIMNGIRAEALQTYSRKERCCREKLVPETLLLRVL